MLMSEAYWRDYSWFRLPSFKFSLLSYSFATHMLATVQNLFSSYLYKHVLKLHRKISANNQLAVLNVYGEWLCKHQCLRVKWHKVLRPFYINSGTVLCEGRKRTDCYLDQLLFWHEDCLFIVTADCVRGVGYLNTELELSISKLMLFSASVTAGGYSQRISSW
jgi:hypothetical protein